ncbi:hypothetical protein L1987_01320 [Smallanthus sonchifolius]|uniref:Uncharacterized protein n=1 Tax=Smallanthus sonchifolius TaxID=185202 RepID=A0ACB9K4S0_9ASTR|nr:hypothetical protein L1987_01320 [Smallanthus sonchifolius]
MECQKTKDQTAYPVFYDVEPTEVRNQSGAVGEAFAKHVKGSWIFSFIKRLTRKRMSENEEEDDVGRWRIALKEAASLAGMELKNTFNGHEAMFIQKVVKDICLKLHSINLIDDENLVGMKTRVMKVVSYLESGFDDVQMIGIKGMGGGGKTTLARAIFDHMSIRFEGKSFVENVREVSKGSSSGLKKLQKQVLQDVLNDQSIDVTSVFDGKKKMKKVLCSRKVLVVLDDVDDIHQLEALAGSSKWFKSGSKIIITTRDEQVLVISQRVNLIHDVDLLSHEEAICLFSSYAFGREIPDEGYEELSENVLDYAAGLPLTIKVLGSHLCGRSKMKDEAIRILESCGYHAEIGLRVLEQKSLITISNDGRLGLHDHIEEMGRNIVRRLHPDEPNRHNRLWIKEEIEYILDNDLVRFKFTCKGTEATRSIKLLNTHLSADIIMRGLRNMNELRFLYVDTPFGGVDEVDQYLPDTLQSLHWPGYPLECLPQTFQTNELADLAMVQSNIFQLSEGGERKVLNKLRFLDLKYSKLRTFNLGMTIDLEMLDLKKCNDFLELHMPVALLKLKFLNLSGSMLPQGLDRLECLEELYLMDCISLRDIPNSICNMKCLKYLHLPYCILVTRLPEELGRLVCLKELNIEGAGISHLPQGIFELKGLCIVWSRGRLESYGFTSLTEISRYTASGYV